MFGLKDCRQGIVHVAGSESGLSLPGMTIVCGDSHTCIHSALGALAWEVGTSELCNVLGTQCLMVKKSKTMCIELTGTLDENVGPMDVIPGQPIKGIKIQQVFIGSCSNGRLSNILQVAELVKDKHVAEGVVAWVVLGSQKIKCEAEKLELDKIIKEAGFVWGEPCCSLCGGCNGERVPAGYRCVSTTNRNFIGRQGPGARTHLASPYTAAMAAIKGRIE